MTPYAWPVFRQYLIAKRVDFTLADARHTRAFKAKIKTADTGE
jgi:hypothetical protein